MGPKDDLILVEVGQEVKEDSSQQNEVVVKNGETSLQQNEVGIKIGDTSLQHIEVGIENGESSVQQNEVGTECKELFLRHTETTSVPKEDAKSIKKDIFLFDPAILEKLDWSSVTHMKDGVTSSNPGAGFKVRPLRKDDYDKGFLQLLSQLTHVGDISKESFEEQFDFMKSCPNHYYITVVEDTKLGKLISAATLAVEFKFIRNCAKRGRLEDVVVDDTYRGKQLGKLIVSTITLLAKSVGCYKIGLDCRDSIRFFYESLGYHGEQGNDRSMIIRF